VDTTEYRHQESIQIDRSPEDLDSFRPADGGTEVTQTWEVLPDYGAGLGLDESGTVAVLDMMKGAALQGMPETLAALKADAEAAITTRSRVRCRCRRNGGDRAGAP
jgi:hypothetical protein